MAPKPEPIPDRDEESIARHEVRLRRVFVGSICLSFLIVFLLMIVVPQWDSLPKAIHYAFPAILFWSLLVSAYSFYAQHTLASNVKERLRRKTYLDEVTQVFNYRYLDLRLAEEAERTRRHGGLTAVLYLDLDGFKDVNDRFGHQTGNAVLAELAQTLNRQVRSCDVFGRVGGDEFLAVLPQTGRREAYVLAERLREAVDNYVFETKNGQIIDFVTVSIGVAAYPVNGETMENVITAADNAVYESKEKDGNAVTMAGEYVAVDTPVVHDGESLRGRHKLAE